MMQQEALMSQLALELDNGRLLRLLARLVMVSEGSQTSLEPNWSETGQHTHVLASLTFEMLWIMHVIAPACVQATAWFKAVCSTMRVHTGLLLTRCVLIY